MANATSYENTTVSPSSASAGWTSTGIVEGDESGLDEEEEEEEEEEGSEEEKEAARRGSAPSSHVAAEILPVAASSLCLTELGFASKPTIRDRPVSGSGWLYRTTNETWL